MNDNKNKRVEKDSEEENQEKFGEDGTEEKIENKTIADSEQRKWSANCPCCCRWTAPRCSRMDSEKYVTVIPVEYPRPHAHSAHQYHDCSDTLSPENVSANQLPNYIEMLSAGNKRSKYLLNDQDSFCTNDSNETRNDFYSNSSNQALPVCVYLMNDVVLHMQLEDGNNTSVADLVRCVIELDELALPDYSKNIFTLWMSSGLLELQLKPCHKPLLVRAKWNNLLSRFAHASLARQLRDEPILSLQRNIFYPLHEEQKLTDVKVLELLYEEAKCNILEGRYPCDITQYTMLGGIQARLELGPYNPQVHTNKFLRSQKNKFLPVHSRHDPITSWFRSHIKNSPEVRLLEHYKRIPNSATEAKLQKRYLEVCWSFSYYACAFFQGQIEEPVRGLTSLLMHQDLPILIGINERGIYLIDNVEARLLLDLKFEDFSWELGKPNKNSDHCLPCIFLQFATIENGARVSKIMQIFSKQADMMDALIGTFVSQRKKQGYSNSLDEMDGSKSADHPGNRYRDGQFCKLSNKLNKLTLATLDDEAESALQSSGSSHCIGQMGSLKFVY